MTSRPDSYRTLREAAEARCKVQRSEFIGVAFPADSESAFGRQLADLQKSHFSATHHCWGYRLFDDGRLAGRSSDAGEPAGTAGRPIVTAIESAGLADVGLVVIRYFGGVKLGTGGLSRAYRDAAQLVLREAPVEERFVYQRITVAVPFARMNDVYRLIEPPDILLAGERFGEVNEFDFDIRRSHVEQFTRRLETLRLEWRNSTA
jgi:uncharacterized YigZ family protein